jgi:hypothetical protein
LPSPGSVTRRHLVAGYIALNLFLVGLGLWINNGLHHHDHPSRAASTRPTGAAERSTARPAAARQRPRSATRPPRRAAPPRKAVPPLLIVATRGPSWVLVRRGSASGPVLYEGVLGGGKTLRLPPKAVYLRAGVASNLDVRFGSRRAELPCYAADGTIVTQDGTVPVAAAGCLTRLGS